MSENMWGSVSTGVKYSIIENDLEVDPFGWKEIAPPGMRTILVCFFLMNLANLPNLAKKFTFYTKDLNLSPKCS